VGGKLSLFFNKKGIKMIQLKKNNILREPLYDEDGNITDFVFEFDMEDIEYPLKINQSFYEHKKNLQSSRDQFRIIDKKEDRKTSGLLTWKEQQKLNAYKEFYDKEIKAMDLILGEGKTEQFLKAIKRKPYYSMFEDISELIEPLLPKLQNITDDITAKIKEKYKTKEENILE
jgi:hypothetical protein